MAFVLLEQGNCSDAVISTLPLLRCCNSTLLLWQLEQMFHRSNSVLIALQAAD
jgi:hypothetical protein